MVNTDGRPTIACGVEARASRLQSEQTQRDLALVEEQRRLAEGPTAPLTMRQARAKLIQMHADLLEVAHQMNRDNEGAFEAALLEALVAVGIAASRLDDRIAGQVAGQGPGYDKPLRFA